MLTVKQAAKQLGMSEHTIRYYTDQGLVPTVKRNARNDRLFDESAMDWLYGCKLLRSTGIPLKQLKRYIDLYRLGNSTIKERHDLLVNEKQQALDKLAEAKRNVDFLDQRIKVYEDAIKNNKDLGSLNPKGNFNDEN